MHGALKSSTMSRETSREGTTLEENVRTSHGSAAQPALITLFEDPTREGQSPM